jgi:pentapeptide MXKDX repeat protein
VHIRKTITIGIVAALSLAACGDDDTTADTAPAATEDTMSADTMSEDTMSEDTMSGDTMSGDTMSEDTMSADTMSEETDVVSVIAGRDDLTTLVAAIETAGLGDALGGAGPFTIFAPTDAAFEAYFGEMGMTADDVLADAAGLTALLQGHVVAGNDDAAMVMDMADQSFTTLAGTSLAVTVDGDTTMVGNSTIVEYDLAAPNGVVHVIDSVLDPAG